MNTNIIRFKYTMLIIRIINAYYFIIYTYCFGYIVL